MVTIDAANLLGDKFINITKGRPRDMSRPAASCKSLEGQDIPELMARPENCDFISSDGETVRHLLDGVEAGQGNLGNS